jgi:hypothetical protein
MHRTLGTALATPLAVPVVHAWRAALVSTGEDSQRILCPANPQLVHATPDQQVAGGQPVRRLWIGVLVRPPWHLFRAGQRQLGLDAVIVGLQLGVGDRPVCADASRLSLVKSSGHSRSATPPKCMVPPPTPRPSRRWHCSSSSLPASGGRPSRTGRAYVASTKPMPDVLRSPLLGCSTEPVSGSPFTTSQTSAA